MSEAHAARQPYAYLLSATHSYERGAHFICRLAFDLADSPEEAEGRALKACRTIYPEKDGWGSHRVSVGNIPDLGSIGRIDYKTLKVESCPS